MPGCWRGVDVERRSLGAGAGSAAGVAHDGFKVFKQGAEAVDWSAVIERMASDHGHIVLRVAPVGGSYRVVIVDDTSESHLVTKTFGPYTSR